LEYQIGKVRTTSWANLTLYYISRLQNKKIANSIEEILCYLFYQILTAGISSHADIVAQLTIENKNIIALIDDLEMLE